MMKSKLFAFIFSFFESRNSFFGSHSSANAPSNRTCNNSEFSSPIGNGLSSSVGGYQMRISSVLGLLAHCCPAAIFRLIVAVVINSVNTVARTWTRSHIFKKTNNSKFAVFAVKPSVTNFNSASAVILETGAGRCVTTRLHKPISIIFDSFRASVFVIAVFGRIADSHLFSPIQKVFWLGLRVRWNAFTDLFYSTLNSRLTLLKPAILLVLTLFCFGSVKAQTEQPLSTIQTTNDEVRRIQLVAALERAQTEVKAARKFIEGLEASIKSKEKRIDELDRRDGKRVEIQNSLESEIKNLRAAVAEQKNALIVKQEESDYLKKELQKTQKKLKSSYKREKFLAGIAAVLAAILVLKR